MHKDHLFFGKRREGGGGGSKIYTATVSKALQLIVVCLWPGFAVNLQLLLDHPEARIDPNAPRGHLETSLLENLVTQDQLEPLGDDCTKVM